jgi:hypothetical protein
MPLFTRVIISGVFLLSCSLSANAGWNDLLDKLPGSIKDERPQAGSGSAQQNVASGLKQALRQGVDMATRQLGKTNGFLHDPSVRIPMPETLKKVEKGLRKIGRDKYADRFIVTMNQAAEKAVPQTTTILLNAVKAMSLDDAMAILNGEQDAATRYFRRSSSEQLRDAIRPIVTDATDAVGLTENYKKMISKAGFLASYIDEDSLDIDRYITSKTLDGLFVKIANEEKRIRNDPLARTTDLLREVFGQPR